MRTLRVFLLSILLVPVLQAASLNFAGNFRGETAFYHKLGLAPNTPSKTFSSGRILLQPRLVIDDHFSVRSQWSLLTSPTITPNATVPLSNGQGGYILGDRNTEALVLSRAWLEWTSDFGVLRFGRMPVAWGYGLLYDAGTRTWDDFQTTFDRLEYQLHLGYVVGGIGISKERKNSVLGGVNDSTIYSAYLQYDNPESQVQGGVLFEKQARNSGQTAELTNQAQSPTYDPNGGPTSTQAAQVGLPSGSKVPYPLSNNVVDVYLKKALRYFELGGELAWISGKAADYNQDSIADNLNAIAALISANYTMNKVNTFVEFLYASGDSNVNSGNLGGFVLLHRNRRPGLILGRELLGPYAGNTVAQGSLVAYGDTDSFSGVWFLRPGVRIDWSPSWTTGLEVIFAQKVAATATEQKNLGVEVDLGVDHAVHKNADLGAAIGFLIPGEGLRVANPQGPFAVRATLNVTF